MSLDGSISNDPRANAKVERPPSLRKLGCRKTFQLYCEVDTPSAANRPPATSSDQSTRRARIKLMYQKRSSAGVKCNSVTSAAGFGLSIFLNCFLIVATALSIVSFAPLIQDQSQALTWLAFIGRSSVARAGALTADAKALGRRNRSQVSEVWNGVLLQTVGRRSEKVDRQDLSRKRSTRCRTQFENGVNLFGTNRASRRHEGILTIIQLTIGDLRAF